MIIGDDVFLGPGVVFTNDLRPRAHIKRMGSSLLGTTVLSGVTLGAGVTVVCGTTIGGNAFVGAGAVIGSAIIGNAIAGPPPGYAYRGYAPVDGYAAYADYGGPAPVGYPGGYWARRPVFDRWGNQVGWSRPRFFCPY